MSKNETTYSRTQETVVNADKPLFNRDDMKYYYDKGFTFQQIAKIMGCSYSLVRLYMTGLGHKNNPARKTSNNNWDDVAFLELYLRGKNDREIGDVLNVRRQTVQQKRVNEHNLPPNAAGRQSDDDAAFESGQIDIKDYVQDPQPKFKQPSKPIPREDWVRERVDDLSSYLQHQLSTNQALDTELLAEYQQHTQP